jgi:anti-sigma factor RsiW
MTDRWTDRLSDYVDGSLSPAEARALESHLSGCPDCTVVLADLRDLVARARGIREIDSSASADLGSDLWPGIEARIRDLPVSTVRVAEPARADGADRGAWLASRLSVSMPQLALAAVAFLAISSAIFWVAFDIGGREGTRRFAAGSSRIAMVPASSSPVEAALSEIKQLKRILRERREEIDPETLRALEESLRSVETAVDEARRALEADPDNSYIQSHLEELTERQLDLLRRAVALAGGAE